MANNAVSNWPFLNRPRLLNSVKRFVVVGDGRTGPVEPAPPTVTRAKRITDQYRLVDIAQNPSNQRLVCATLRAGITFVYSDDMGLTWTEVTVATFVGYCDKVFWQEGLNMFVALSAPGASHPLLFSTDGVVWALPDASSFVNDLHWGYDYSPLLDILVIGYAGSGDNVLIFDGALLSVGSTGESDGRIDIVWNVDTEEFLGFQSGTNLIYSSTDALTWSVAGPTPDDVLGRYTAYSLASGRLLLFCQTALSFYSDDNGSTWTESSGITENSGSIIRHVAIDGDVIYVAFNNDPNYGITSTDGGETWSESGHYSGNASGVAAIS